MLTKILTKVFGSPSSRAIKKLQPTVKKINKFAKEYSQSITTEEEVKAKTAEFKERIAKGESLEKILPEAFALVKVACGHLVGKSWEVRGHQVEWEIQSPYDVQLIGAIVMHQGNIAEMRTGEGKTLVCTMPVYLNALSGKGVFVVTVNEYLAVRDAEWMGGLYKYLGLTVGSLKNGTSHAEKKAAYACDVVYGTNNEFGFDYLRDNMARSKDMLVQRELNYAIVDEVDSILIDESRTPLIISAPAAESTEKYARYATIIPQLTENTHYDVDEKSKTATLTEEGVAKMEEILGLENIYTEAGFSEVHHIEQALRAATCYQKDTDYIVQEGRVIIIDEFTGRLMAGRRYGQGLHQAIEAKEGVEIKRESKTLATVTFQNYFRMFKKLAGMTGTAETEAEEFYQIYGLDTLVIPTNKPIARDDMQDSIYKNQRGKYTSIVRKIKELHEKGQPVLVGTISVERSELISGLLKQAGIPHNVLNAKHHEQEAEIVANAGQKGAVTIATNMAGRGTDIKLGPGVKELGGLFVLGTERHESRRIDNQLRGRSGRQGDPGASQFFISMEDELMRLFGGERMLSIMETLKVPEDMPVENGIISRSIESAQKKVEGRNFDIRKHLVEYDDVMNVQREIVYKRRRDFLLNEEHQKEVQEMIDEIAESLVLNHTSARKPKEWNYQEILEAVTAIYKSPEKPLSLEEISEIKDPATLTAKVQTYLKTGYEMRKHQVPDAKIMPAIEKAIFLRACDILWMEHITTMGQLRQNVAFSGYAQKQPLIEYKSQGFQMFQEMLARINSNTINTLFKIDLDKIVPSEILQKSATKNARTNAAQIEGNISGHNQNPATKPTQPQSNSTNRRQAAQNPTLIQADSSPHTASILAKLGRNEACACGSGKKVKKCCGK